MKHYLRFGWPNKRNVPSDLISYYEKRNDISVEEDVLIWQDRIIVPETLKNEVLKFFHVGHPGITAMKSLTQFYVWWPAMNKDIEEHVNRCVNCQSNRNNEIESPLYSWNITQLPWMRVHIDLAGPVDGVYWLVLVDAHSKWCEVYIIKHITAQAIIQNTRDAFSRLGVPNIVVSDNGTQFTSNSFVKFLTDNGIKHIKSSPYHPKTNGQVERTIQTIKNKYKKLSDIQDIRERLSITLFWYRVTPHQSSGKSPAEAMFRRKLNTLIDNIRPDILKNLEFSSTKQFIEHDKNSRYREFQAGDNVWVKNEQKKGFHPGRVIDRTGDLSYKIEVDGHTQRKHADQLRTRLEPLDSKMESNVSYQDEYPHKDEQIEIMSEENREPTNILLDYQPFKELLSNEEQPVNETKPLRRSQRIKEKLERNILEETKNQNNKNGRM